MADKTITITIKDEHTQRIMDAYNVSTKDELKVLILKEIKRKVLEYEREAYFEAYDGNADSVAE